MKSEKSHLKYFNLKLTSFDCSTQCCCLLFSLLVPWSELEQVQSYYNLILAQLEINLTIEINLFWLLNSIFCLLSSLLAPWPMPKQVQSNCNLSLAQSTSIWTIMNIFLYFDYSDKLGSAKSLMVKEICLDFIVCLHTETSRRMVDEYAIFAGCVLVF